MFRGLWKLTWLEIKIFLREPLGAFGSILFPVLVFVVVGRVLGRPASRRLDRCHWIHTGRAAGFGVSADGPQRSVVAGHDHLDLS